MASVARHIHDGVVLTDFFYLIDIMDGGTVVNFVPYPGQENVEKSHIGIGDVGGDFVSVFLCTFSQLVALQAIFGHFFFNRCAHHRTIRDLMNQCASM